MARLLLAYASTEGQAERIADSIAAVLRDRGHRVDVIGGGEIYRRLIASADRLIVTRIHREYEGDTYFPEYRDQIGTVWKETTRKEYDEFTVVEYDRIDH